MFRDWYVPGYFGAPLRPKGQRFKWSEGICCSRGREGKGPGQGTRRHESLPPPTPVAGGGGGGVGLGSGGLGGWAVPQGHLLMSPASLNATVGEARSQNSYERN